MQKSNIVELGFRELQRMQEDGSANERVLEDEIPRYLLVIRDKYFPYKGQEDIQSRREQFEEEGELYPYYWGGYCVEIRDLEKKNTEDPYGRASLGMICSSLKKATNWLRRIDAKNICVYKRGRKTIEVGEKGLFVGRAPGEKEREKLEEFLQAA